MSTGDVSPSDNGMGSDAWSRPWTHLRSPGIARATAG